MPVVSKIETPLASGEGLLVSSKKAVSTGFELSYGVQSLILVTGILAALTIKFRKKIRKLLFLLYGEFYAAGPTGFTAG